MFRVVKQWPAKSVKKAASKPKLRLTPITQRGLLPNFVYLDAEQMPGYERFEKHEIVRWVDFIGGILNTKLSLSHFSDGRTTESPYLVEYIQNVQDYSKLGMSLLHDFDLDEIFTIIHFSVDERTPAKAKDE